MSAAMMLVLVVILSFLNLHDAAAQSQVCEEPFKATIIVTVNVTIPISSSSLDPDLKILRFTEKEIDRDREAAMRFFEDMYGLDFTSIEPNEQGQRILGNATFEPNLSSFNFTYVFNSWLVSGRPKTKCFPAASGTSLVLQCCFVENMVVKKENWFQQMKMFCTAMTMFLMLVSNRDLPSTSSHLPHSVVYQLMAILLLYFEFIIVCLEKELWRS